MNATSVLIVEEESEVARDLAERLIGLGYDVAGVAGSGEEAVRLAGAKQPGVVLMDMRLRDRLDGIEAAREIGDHLDIPLVYLTSFASEAEEERIKESAPSKGRAKPHDERDLMAGVLGYTDLLLGDLKHDPESTVMLREIGKCARRANELTQQMLAFACAS